MQIQDARDLGSAIRTVRKAKGYTLEQIAGVTGVGVRFLSELENGKPTVELNKALRVASILGITIAASDPDGHVARLEEALDRVRGLVGRRSTNAGAPPLDEAATHAIATKIAAADPTALGDASILRHVDRLTTRRRTPRFPALPAGGDAEA